MSGLGNAQQLERTFRRNGSDGKYVRIFSALPPSEKHILIATVPLDDAEAIVIGGVKGGEPWIVLTTKKVIGRGSHGAVSLPLAAIRSVREDPTEFLSPSGKAEATKLVVEDFSGVSHLLEVEAGGPYFGIWNVLLRIGRSNKASRKRLSL